MFVKDIYKNAFYMSNYKDLTKKSLMRAIGYMVMLVFFSGAVSIFCGYLSKKDVVENAIESIYDSIPNFNLSTEGFDIDSDKPIIFSFAGIEFYIDDSREFTNMVLEEKVEDDKSVVFIGSNGYGIVKGNILERASYYEYMPKLEGITLTKDDFSIIYETIQFIIKDLFVLIGVICSISLMFFVFVKSIMYSIVLILISKYKGEKAKFKDTLKVMLYSHTFYVLYYGIILLSPMNLSFILKMMIFEIISLCNVFYIGLNYKKEVV